MEITPTSNQLNVAPAHTDTNNDGVQATANFAQTLGGAVNVAGQVAGTVAGASGFGLGPVGGLGKLVGGNAGSLNNPLDGNLGDMSFTDLLTLQNQLQKESAVFNSMSNISKTEHETRMSAIRNMKA